MKRLSLFLLLIVFLFRLVSAEEIIIEDYYLNNRSSVETDVTDVSKVLPNTLRIELFEGEMSELYADVIPGDATVARVSWKLLEKSGIAELYPKGNRCVIEGLHEGEEKLEVRAESGAFAVVDIAVYKKVEKKLYEDEQPKPEPQKKEAFTHKHIRIIARILTVLAIAFLLTAVILFLQGRKRNER